MGNGMLSAEALSKQLCAACASIVQPLMPPWTRLKFSRMVACKAPTTPCKAPSPPLGNLYPPATPKFPGGYKESSRTCADCWSMPAVRHFVTHSGSVLASCAGLNLHRGPPLFRNTRQQGLGFWVEVGWLVCTGCALLRFLAR